MTKLIDNTEMLVQAHQLIGYANDLLKRLDAVDKDTPAKVQTYDAIKLVIETQSEVIRKLVEQHMQICDHLNKIIITHPNL
jgi:hypothetical protein